MKTLSETKFSLLQKQFYLLKISLGSPEMERVGCQMRVRTFWGRIESKKGGGVKKSGLIQTFAEANHTNPFLV